MDFEIVEEFVGFPAAGITPLRDTTMHDPSAAQPTSTSREMALAGVQVVEIAEGIAGP